jgi:arylformamidase
MPLIDITRPVSADLPVWPGDTPYQFRFAWKMADGASVNVGAVTTTTHLGTHADAPLHFDHAGKSIDAIDLAVYVGPAIVIDARGRPTIDADAFAAVTSATPRVLVRTDAWPVGSPFPQTVPTLTEAAVTLLRERGVVLLGVDVPSVDAIDSKTLPIHHALHAAGIAIVESLDLAHVEPSTYDLISLPLKLAGADASPVRAVLVKQ